MRKMILTAALLLSGARTHAQDISLSLRILAPYRYELEGRFSTPAPRDTAWAVLSDYENIPAFVSSMRYSKVKERGAESALLEQESIGRVFIFRHTVHVLLEVREQPRRRISFQDVSRACFESYEGEWRLEDSLEGTTIIYRLAVTEGSALPRFVPKSVVRKAARTLLKDVALEMARRTLGTGAAGPRPRGRL